MWFKGLFGACKVQGVLALVVTMSSCGGSDTDPNSILQVDAGDDAIGIEREFLNVEATVLTSNNNISRWEWYSIINNQQTNYPSQQRLAIYLPEVEEDTNMTVTLKATDDRGFSNTDTFNIIIKAYQNIADTTFTDTELTTCFKDRYLRFSDSYDIGHVTYLDCENKSIKSLEGLEQLVRLENIKLSYNPQINLNTLNSDLQYYNDDTLPSMIDTLIELDLSYSNITDVSQLPLFSKLERLYLQNNNLDVINRLSIFTTLQRLDLSNNPLTDFSSLLSLVNLTRLDMENANISSSSSLVNLTKMVRLGLRYANLTEINAISNMPELDFLDVSHNALGFYGLAPIANNTKLMALYFSNNNIGDLSPLTNLLNLNYLYFYGNAITDISTLASLVNITSMGFGYIAVSDMNHLVNLTKLETLFLNGLNITDMNFIANLTNITQLGLSGNNISDISFLGMYNNLVYLNLSDNEFSNISVLSGIDFTEILNLSGNILIFCSALDQLESSLSSTVNFTRPYGCQM